MNVGHVLEGVASGVGEEPGLVVVADAVAEHSVSVWRGVTPHRRERLKECARRVADFKRGVLECPLLAVEEPTFVIAGHTLDTALFQHFESRVGVSRTVDQITNTEDGLDIHRPERVEHSLERFGLAVNVADHPQSAEHARVAHRFNLEAF
jgi:chorismate mutase